MKKQDNAIAAAGRNVLIVGASFAGLSMAYWMCRLGYDVTIVEIATGLRLGGTPVDIRDRTIDIAARMGILDAIKAQSLPPRATEFKNANDVTEASLPPASVAKDGGMDGYEIDRDALLAILLREVEGRIDIRFGMTVAGLEDSGEEMRARFADGTERAFSLVLGCDGNHSAVRTMIFGPESQYSQFLGACFSISIVAKRIIEPNTTQVYSVPGRTVMLNSYEDKTDIVLCFRTDNDTIADQRDPDHKRRVILDRFADMGWRTPELLEEVKSSENFYFDKLSQVKMPSWTKGRVALVGDAAYCASPASGMGGSLAIIGAAALAEALGQYGDDHALAFEAYNNGLRRFIAEVQQGAVAFGLDTFVPSSEEAIRARNEQFSSASTA
ncbi:2-polyprenyl-6-methoxyphenol hydroxylase-like FAD-dependent oxidoreductase [Sphingopyxis panaciterrae]|uniref:FAD-dependent monooxygenase n=1 Tax=Sphingopyxis panaciterrae TaxID=363841 RepID=UPI00141E89D8|nr:FAD-dependent monooxygenase [Sphingopyxis panaciterrae]NIJ37620.1 2-polyprenyl-6-methoxyphenol hydroxylase-like FAD-dependent oxidoreductase [Sphingopyxis panaciterrae]